MRKHPAIRSVVLPAALASVLLPFSAGAGATTTHSTNHHAAVAGAQVRIFEPTPEATVRVPAAVAMITRTDFLMWSRVAICEQSGNWHVLGSKYSGGLGISNVNWVAYGGRQFAWNAAYATPAEQIVVANRINAGYGVPDQNGCADW